MLAVLYVEKNYFRAQFMHSVCLPYREYYEHFSSAIVKTAPFLQLTVYLLIQNQMQEDR